jgi:hypothetical protein
MIVGMGFESVILNVLGFIYENTKGRSDICPAFCILSVHTANMQGYALYDLHNK